MSKKSLPSIFVKDGPAIRMMPHYHNENILDHVPAKIYQVMHDDKGEFLYPSRMEFTIPKKIYGDHKVRKDIVIADFKKNSKKGPIGVLMTGEKGTGKSLLAEDLSNYFLTAGLPVLWIESAVPAKALRSVIRQIGKCVVFFEEFSKIYPEKSLVVPDQQELLTLFSDRGLSEVVFLVVENTSRDISKYLHLRPQRFKWHFEFPKPGYEMFSEILGDYQLPSAIYNYFKRYFELGDNSNEVYGIDVFETLVEVAKESKTLNEVLNKVKYLNVPHYLSLTSTWSIPLCDKLISKYTLKNAEGKVVSDVDVTSEFINVEVEYHDGTTKIFKVNLLGSPMLDAVSSGFMGNDAFGANIMLTAWPTPKIRPFEVIRYNSSQSKEKDDSDEDEYF